MKKLTLIISGLLILSLGSCTKESIEPKVKGERKVITHSTGDEKSNTYYKHIKIGIPLDTIITITDPNRDEDEEKRAKRK